MDPSDCVYRKNNFSSDTKISKQVCGFSYQGLISSNFRDKSQYNEEKCGSSKVKSSGESFKSCIESISANETRCSCYGECECAEFKSFGESTKCYSGLTLSDISQDTSGGHFKWPMFKSYRYFSKKSTLSEISQCSCKGQCECSEFKFCRDSFKSNSDSTFEDISQCACELHWKHFNSSLSEKNKYISKRLASKDDSVMSRDFYLCNDKSFMIDDDFYKQTRDKFQISESADNSRCCGKLSLADKDTSIKTLTCNSMANMAFIHWSDESLLDEQYKNVCKQQSPREVFGISENFYQCFDKSPLIFRFDNVCEKGDNMIRTSGSTYQSCDTPPLLNESEAVSIRKSHNYDSCINTKFPQCSDKLSLSETEKYLRERQSFSTSCICGDSCRCCTKSLPADDKDFVPIPRRLYFDNCNSQCSNRSTLSDKTEFVPIKNNSAVCQCVNFCQCYLTEKFKSNRKMECVCGEDCQCCIKSMSGEKYKFVSLRKSRINIFCACEKYCVCCDKTPLTCKFKYLSERKSFEDICTCKGSCSSCANGSSCVNNLDN